jgi:hypothetical protein
MYNVFIRVSSRRTIGWRFYGYTMFEIIDGIVKYPILYGIRAGETVVRVNFYKVGKSMTSID